MFSSLAPLVVRLSSMQKVGGTSLVFFIGRGVVLAAEVMEYEPSLLLVDRLSSVQRVRGTTLVFY